MARQTMLLRFTNHYNINFQYIASWLKLMICYFFVT
jgi:hypothetical protein